MPWLVVIFVLLTAAGLYGGLYLAPADYQQGDQPEGRRRDSLERHVERTPQAIDQIVASIRSFGFTNPILVDPDGGVIAGHGRLLAAKALGLALPVKVVFKPVMTTPDAITHLLVPGKAGPVPLSPCPPLPT